MMQQPQIAGTLMISAHSAKLTEREGKLAVLQLELQATEGKLSARSAALAKHQETLAELRRELEKPT